MRPRWRERGDGFVARRAAKRETQFLAGYLESSSRSRIRIKSERQLSSRTNLWNSPGVPDDFLFYLVTQVRTNFYSPRPVTLTAVRNRSVDNASGDFRCIQTGRLATSRVCSAKRNEKLVYHCAQETYVAIKTCRVDWTECEMNAVWRSWPDNHAFYFYCVVRTRSSV